MHHQRLRNLVGPPQPPRAACSCGWDGPERRDEQWSDADWFGHEVDIETRWLDQFDPEDGRPTPRPASPPAAVTNVVSQLTVTLKAVTVSWVDAMGQLHESLVSLEGLAAVLARQTFCRPGPLCIDGREYRRRQRARARNRR